MPNHNTGAPNDNDDDDGSERQSFLARHNNHEPWEESQSKSELEEEKESFLSTNEGEGPCTAAPLEIIVPDDGDNDSSVLVTAANKEEEEEEERSPNTKSRGKVMFSLLLVVLVGGTTRRTFSMGSRSNNHENREGVDHSPSSSSTCFWAPGNHTNCLNAIQSLVCQNNTHGDDNNDDDDRNKIPRLLLFGDSTMDRLFRWGGTWKNLVSLDKKHELRDTGLVRCKVRNGGRCHLNEQFGYFNVEDSVEWTAPNFSAGEFAGPLTYHPYCQDCRGCSPTKIDCEPLEKSTEPWDMVLSSLTTLNQRKRLVYGGYMGIEYARDVELQTSQFRTTQENVAHYIGQTWNAPDLLRVWQKPTCVVNAGHHDVKIPNITMQDYVANVQWYLHLLVDKCRHIFWLSTTSPQRDNPVYIQTINQTGAWGYAVYNMIKDDPLLHNKSLYINVFEASKTFQHHDNIHMDKEWYQSLGTLFREETFLDCP